MTMTATQLRSRLYEALRTIERTGEPLEVELKDSRFLISRAEPASRLARMQPQRDAIVDAPDDLAGFSPWSESAWRERWDGLLRKP